MLVLCVVLSAGVGLAQGKKPAKANEEPSPQATRGKAIYAKHCEICHYAQAEAMKIAPGLKGIYKRGKYADGKKVDDDTMRGWIEKGSNKMPPFKDTLNAQQVNDLIAYIRTL